MHPSSKIVLIKFGGSTLDDSATKTAVARDVAELKRRGTRPVVVHGGGKELSRWMEKLGLAVRFIDGLRYTDADAIAITEMVFAGRLGSEIVSLIELAGAPAIGLSGRNGGLFRAKKIRSSSGKDLGFVGQIEKSDTSIVTAVLDAGFIPVVSSLAADGDGGALNINADHAAAILAAALEVEQLICLTDVEGINVDGVVRRRLSVDSARALLKHPDVRGGMIPKLSNAIEAIERGVSRVRIVNAHTPHALLSCLDGADIGTTITSG